jgi:hypothetical protein
MYVMYYALMFRCFQLVRILVKTIFLKTYGEDMLRCSYKTIFLKTYGEDMLRCSYKDYSSLNRWQANRDLLSAFTFSNDASPIR